MRSILPGVMVRSTEVAMGAAESRILLLAGP